MKEETKRIKGKEENIEKEKDGEREDWGEKCNNSDAWERRKLWLLSGIKWGV